MQAIAQTRAIQPLASRGRARCARDGKRAAGPVKCRAMGDDSHSDTVEVKGDWRAFRYARNPRRVAKRPARNDRFPDTFSSFSLHVVNSQDAARGFERSLAHAFRIRRIDR